MYVTKFEFTNKDGKAVEVPVLVEKFKFSEELASQDATGTADAGAALRAVFAAKNIFLFNSEKSMLDAISASRSSQPSDETIAALRSYSSATFGTGRTNFWQLPTPETFKASEDTWLSAFRAPTADFLHTINRLAYRATIESVSGGSNVSLPRAYTIELKKVIAGQDRSAFRKQETGYTHMVECIRAVLDYKGERSLIMPYLILAKLTFHAGSPYPPSEWSDERAIYAELERDGYNWNGLIMVGSSFITPKFRARGMFLDATASIRRVSDLSQLYAVYLAAVGKLSPAEAMSELHGVLPTTCDSTKLQGALAQRIVNCQCQLNDMLHILTRACT